MKILNRGAHTEFSHSRAYRNSQSRGLWKFSIEGFTAFSNLRGLTEKFLFEGVHSIV